MSRHEPRLRLSQAITALLVSALFASPAGAQTDKQVWSEFTLDWIKSHTWTFGVDIEPTVLVAKQPDEPGWPRSTSRPRPTSFHLGESCS